MIVETWLDPSRTMSFPGYDVVRRDSPRIIAGGVAIIINKNINYAILPCVDIPGAELLLIEVLSTPSYIVGAIYVAPNASFSFDSFNNIFAAHSRIIIGGDYNAKHAAWNNLSNNARGVRLFHYLNSTNVTLLHSDSYSYKLPGKNPSNIDIFLVQNIINSYNCYTVDDLSSNHLPIMLDLNQDSPLKKEKVIFHTDWKKYGRLTKSWNIVRALDNFSKIDSCVSELQNFFHSSYKTSSERRKCGAHNFYGADGKARLELQNLIKLRNHFCRKFQQTGQDRFRVFRNLLNSQIKTKITHVKNIEWDNKIKKLNIPDKSLWHTLKSLQRKKAIIPLFKLSDNSLIYQSKD